MSETYSNNPILSVLVISYNQKDLLKRCLDNLLQQKIKGEWEIIVSDALSKDGTYELAEEYSRRCINPHIVPVHCNTVEGGAVNRTECCGWMKLTAYKAAKGKYFVNIDADDYLRTDDIYQKQIDALERHPECSMCMQRVLSLKDGSSYREGNAWPTHPMLTDGAVIGTEDFVLNDLRGLNQGYMIRRRPGDDLEKLYGKWYDDTVITYHHVQYGPVVFVDRADYVWVQYPKSISHAQKGDEHTLIYGLLPLHHALMIPDMAILFIRQGLKDVIHLMKVAPEYPVIDKPSQDYFAQFKGFLFEYYTKEKHSLCDKLRFCMCRYLALIMNKNGFYSSAWIRIITKLMIA